MQYYRIRNSFRDCTMNNVAGNNILAIYITHTYNIYVLQIVLIPAGFKDDKSM